MKRVLWPVFLVTLLFALTVPMATSVYAHAGMSTRVTISASATEVVAGDTVILTITETNDSAIWIDTYSPDLTDAWVDLQPGVGRLDHTSSGFSSNLDADNVLKRGETWTWTVSVQVLANTTFTVTGHGMTPAVGGEQSVDLTYPYDLDERASVTVTVTPPPPPPPPPGNEGNTPGFWKNHLDAWPAAYSPTGSYFDTVFGVGPHITLLEAVDAKGGGANALIRHAAAAILNAAHPNVDYPLTEAQIIALVQNAFATGNYTDAKDTLDAYNNLGADMSS